MASAESLEACFGACHDKRTSHASSPHLAMQVIGLHICAAVPKELQGR